MAVRPGHQGKEGTNTRISSETCYQERFLPSRLRFEDGIPTRVSLLMGMRYYHRFFHPRDDNLRDLLVASLPTPRLYLPTSPPRTSYSSTQYRFGMSMRIDHTDPPAPHPA